MVLVNAGSRTTSPAVVGHACSRTRECDSVDRHLAQARAGRREYGVCDRGHDARSPRLAYSPGCLVILGDVHFDDRRFVHAQDLIVVEVALLDASAFQSDLAIERGRDAEHDRALYLRLDRVRVDSRAAVDGANDAPN